MRSAPCRCAYCSSSERTWQDQMCPKRVSLISIERNCHFSPLRLPSCTTPSTERKPWTTPVNVAAIVISPLLLLDYISLNPFALREHTYEHALHNHTTSAPGCHCREHRRNIGTLVIVVNRWSIHRNNLLDSHTGTLARDLPSEVAIFDEFEPILITRLPRRIGSITIKTAVAIRAANIAERTRHTRATPVVPNVLSWRKKAKAYSSAIP